MLVAAYYKSARKSHRSKSYIEKIKPIPIVGIKKVTQHGIALLVRSLTYDQIGLN